MPADDLPSYLQLPPGAWPSLVDGLVARFPQVPRAQWLDRFARGRVQDRLGRPLSPDQAWQVGLEIIYFREVAAEPVIPFDEQVLHVDDHLLVADKPHFLPVTPAGRFVRQTLLARLVARTGNRELVPLHRIDRGTAGLVLFSTNPDSRAAYQRLFREQHIDKHYLARAPALPGRRFPLERRTRLERGEPFHRMQETDGVPNSCSRIDALDRAGPSWCYQLTPVSGRKHQLRVHMAGLGAPIIGDDLYPVPRVVAQDNYANPLQLLAHSLAFVDPLSGCERRFESQRTLAGSPDAAAGTCPESC